MKTFILTFKDEDDSMELTVSGESMLSVLEELKAKYWDVDAVEDIKEVIMSDYNTCEGCKYDDKRNLCNHPESNNDWFWDDEEEAAHFGYVPEEYWCKEIE